MVHYRNDKKLNVFRSSGRIHNPVKDGADQQKLERVECSYQGHEQNGRQYLPPVRNGIAHQSRELAHTAPGRPQGLTDGDMSLGCKRLFYCGRWSFVVGRLSQAYWKLGVEG